MLRPLIGLRIRDYFIHVYSKVFIVAGLSAILPAMVYNMMDGTALRFFVVGIVCVVSVSLVAYNLGLTSNEKVFVMEKVRSVILKKIRH